jgi:hypothetical protein
MSWIAAATVAGAAISSNASSKASKGQQQAAGDATAASQREAAIVRQDQAPMRQAGYGALQQWNALLGINPVASGGYELSTRDQIRERLLPNYVGNYGGNGVNDAALDAATDAELARVQAQGQRVGAPNQPNFGQPQNTQQNALAMIQNTPGYGFQLDQGFKGLDRRAAARGGLFSGNAMKEGIRFGQGLASNYFGDHMNRLASTIGFGQTATGASNQAGMNAGYQAGQNAIGAGNAYAANALNQGNIMSNGINQIGAYANRNWGGGGQQSSQGFQNAGWWRGGDGWEGE